MLTLGHRATQKAVESDEGKFFVVSFAFLLRSSGDLLNLSLFFTWSSQVLRTIGPCSWRATRATPSRISSKKSSSICIKVFRSQKEVRIDKRPLWPNSHPNWPNISPFLLQFSRALHTRSASRATPASFCRSTFTFATKWNQKKWPSSMTCFCVSTIRSWTTRKRSSPSSIRTKSSKRNWSKAAAL